VILDDSGQILEDFHVIFGRFPAKANAAIGIRLSDLGGLGQFWTILMWFGTIFG